MSDAPHNEDKLSVGSGGQSTVYNVNRTGPDEIRRHDISDEELALLCSGDRGLKKDILWSALGISAGALSPSISAVKGIVRNPTSFDIWNLIDCVVFSGGFIVFVVMVILLKFGPKEISLEQKIRGRTVRV